METLSVGTSIASQIVSVGRALNRVETLVRHLQLSTESAAIQTKAVAKGELAIVPFPGTNDYFAWLNVLLQHRTSLMPFLQSWLKDSSLLVGGSPTRRIRTIAAHLCAPPMVVDAW